MTDQEKIEDAAGRHAMTTMLLANRAESVVLLALEIGMSKEGFLAFMKEATETAYEALAEIKARKVGRAITTAGAAPLGPTP